MSARLPPLITLTTLTTLSWASAALSVALLSALGGGCAKGSAETTQCVGAVDGYLAEPDRASVSAANHLILASQWCPLGCGAGAPRACQAISRLVTDVCDHQGPAACRALCQEHRLDAACARAQGEPATSAPSP